MFIGHDLGTSANKAVLTTAQGELLGHASASYPIRYGPNGIVEQDPEDWWRAVCETTQALLAQSKVDPADIHGICFAGQMLALVPMNKRGLHNRPAISWMDGRASKQARQLLRRLGGKRIVAALAGGTPTGKDLIPKINWIAENEKAIYDSTVAFCDATGYLVARATGKLRMDPTAAGGTGVYLAKERNWSRMLALLTSFPINKMPRLSPAMKK